MYNIYKVRLYGLELISDLTLCIVVSWHASNSQSEASISMSTGRNDSLQYLTLHWSWLWFHWKNVCVILSKSLVPF